MRLLGCWIALFSVLLLQYTSLFVSARTQPNHGTGQSVFDTLSEQAEKVWGEVSGFGEAARNIAFSRLEEASQTFADVKPQIKELQASLEKIARAVEDFKEKHAKNINLDELSAVLMQELDKVVQHLKTPPDEAPNHEERKKRVEDILGKVEAAVVRVLVSAGVPPEKAQELIDAIHPHIALVTVLTGDLRELHPILFDVVVFAVSAFVVSQVCPPIVRPILKVFGFGPEGPIKGTAAANAQRFFFGGAVPKGNWFAFLQQAGMTGAKNLKGLIGVAAGLSSTLLRRVVVDL